MSAPDTNTETEKQRHKPALIGIRAVMIFAAVLLIGFLLWLVANGQEPREVDTQIDGRTGEEVEAN